MASRSQAESQSKRTPSARSLARFLREAQDAVKLRGQVTVLLTTDAAIRRLNRQFREKDKATDVLSFPAYNQASEIGIHRAQMNLGDIAISVDTARKQANEMGHTPGAEIKVLMLHGLLHLAGYDHETDDGEMARLEESLRAKLRLPRGLIERATAGDTRPSSSPIHSTTKRRNGSGTRKRGPRR